MVVGYHHFRSPPYGTWNIVSVNILSARTPTLHTVFFSYLPTSKISKILCAIVSRYMIWCGMMEYEWDQPASYIDVSNMTAHIHMISIVWATKPKGKKSTEGWRVWHFGQNLGGIFGVYTAWKNSRSPQKWWGLVRRLPRHYQNEPFSFWWNVKQDGPLL